MWIKEKIRNGTCLPGLVVASWRFSFLPYFECSERCAVTRLSASEKRAEVVMLQIMPSTRVPGLMKLLMRNAICLRLLSPLPIACAPMPFLLLYGFFHRVWWLVEKERRGTRLKRWWVFNLFNIYMSYSGLTQALSIWNCLWPLPASLKDPRQCLSYQNLFSGWPCGPASYLKPHSAGLERMWW